MKRVLCTMPWMAGDIMWALPTVRAIAEAHGAPVSFMTSPTYAHVVPLVQAQEYVEHAWVHPGWALRASAPLSPWLPPTDVVGGDYQHFHGGYEAVCHLGYRQWPDGQLAQAIARVGRNEYPWKPLDVDLRRPWLQQVEPRGAEDGVVVGFTDEWVELKAGLASALEKALPASRRPVVLTPKGSRLATEWLLDTTEDDLLHAAEMIAGARLFVGDLSALAVVAAGLGKPRVLVEPDPARTTRTSSTRTRGWCWATTEDLPSTRGRSSRRCGPSSRSSTRRPTMKPKRRSVPKYGRPQQDPLIPEGSRWIRKLGKRRIYTVLHLSHTGKCVYFQSETQVATGMSSVMSRGPFLDMHERMPDEAQVPAVGRLQEEPSAKGE